MNDLPSLKKFTDNLGKQEYTMPVLFVGHGSPMNAIEDNEFSTRWASIAREIPLPAAVLVVSAHWMSTGTWVTAMDFPRTIHDFSGFPRPLYDVRYPVPGNPALAGMIASTAPLRNIGLDHEWGLDHGSWSVVRHIYPEANIPVLQLSIDYTKSPQFHYDLAQELYRLRTKGVLIIGSGNIVHNLRLAAWDKMDVPGYGFDWALEMNDTCKQLIANGDPEPLINYERLGIEWRLAIPTPEHYIPLLYTLGLQNTNDNISFFNDKAVAGSITMTSVKFG